MNKQLFNYLFFIAIIISTTSCGNSFQVDLSDIEKAEIKIQRYDKTLFSEDLTRERLSVLQKQFPLFLGDHPMDTTQIEQIKAYVADPFLLKLFQETERIYPDVRIQEKEISEIFHYVKYYYPGFEYPEVYTYISGSDDAVFYQDNVVIIGIDRFLGSGFELYQSARIPRYKQRFMKPDFMGRAVSYSLAKHYVPPISPNAKLIEQMIYEAKLLYFIKSMNPDMSIEVLLSQTPENTKWLQNKEADIWRYYIENELLYKSDYLDYNKFIGDGPFTSVLGDDSAARTGIYLGYQIVSAYMKKNDDSFLELMNNINAQQILQQSGYKPKK